MINFSHHQQRLKPWKITKSWVWRFHSPLTNEYLEQADTENTIQIQCGEMHFPTWKKNTNYCKLYGQYSVTVLLSNIRELSRMSVKDFSWWKFALSSLSVCFFFRLALKPDVLFLFSNLASSQDQLIPLSTSPFKVLL